MAAVPAQTRVLKDAEISSEYFNRSIGTIPKDFAPTFKRKVALPIVELAQWKVVRSSAHPAKASEIFNRHRMSLVDNGISAGE